MVILKETGESWKKAKEDGRLPSGQSLTLKWPVLHNGSVPVFDADIWYFKITGMVEAQGRQSWDDFRALPQSDVKSDFHCVTRWSRLNNQWRGVLFTDVLKLMKPKPSAAFALVLAGGGYSTNKPLADLMRPDVLFAFEHDGAPFGAEHGEPLRLVVPHLFAWKSAKWVRGFMPLDYDQLGLRERHRYQAYGDPWKGQRYSGGLANRPRDGLLVSDLEKIVVGQPERFCAGFLVSHNNGQLGLRGDRTAR